ncbi:DUF5359 family protein [Salirhabdus euzebyi]
MKRIEKIVKLITLCLFVLLLTSQWLLLNTNINSYINPVYEYIGVNKPISFIDQ